MLLSLFFHLRQCWIDLSHVEIDFRFLKKSSIFSIGKQKANSLTFCAKISFNRQILLNLHWKRVEWTQEMVFNIYHHTRTGLDKTSNSMKKNSKKFFLTNFLKGYFKALPENTFFSKKPRFRFLSIFRI